MTIAARPQLPRPTCRVMLVCGPPAAGKSTYVRNHAGAADSVIDLDLIAREFGYDRERPADATATLLLERNVRLMQLAEAAADHVAWVIVGAPSRKVRDWWRQQLNAEKTILLMPSRAELLERIRKDPDRRDVQSLHLRLIDQWFARERCDDPGPLQCGCDLDGFPTDPLHPWNATKRNSTEETRP
jgi:hypothetical protein